MQGSGAASPVTFSGACRSAVLLLPATASAAALACSAAVLLPMRPRREVPHRDLCQALAHSLRKHEDYKHMHHTLHDVPCCLRGSFQLLMLSNHLWSAKQVHLLGVKRRL